MFATVLRGNARGFDAGVEASGPHDFAVRAGAARLAALPASIASRPSVRDVRNAPFVGDGMALLVKLICPTGKAKYFSRKDWTGSISLNCLGNSLFPCNWTRSIFKRCGLIHRDGRAFSNRALEFARGVAGNGVAVHAGYADIDALIALARIVCRVSLRDAGTLLVGILGFFRTRGQTASHQHQNNDS